MLCIFCSTFDALVADTNFSLPDLVDELVHFTLSGFVLVLLVAGRHEGFRIEAFFCTNVDRDLPPK